MTEKSTEVKEEITFNEFKAWLTGLIRGKRGQLPDLEDWKQIKVMVDKVEPEEETITLPTSITPYDNTNTSPLVPKWSDQTGYAGISPKGAHAVSDDFTSTFNLYGTQVSLSYPNGDLKIEEPAEKIDEIETTKYTINPNASSLEELNIAIDALISALEEPKA